MAFLEVSLLGRFEARIKSGPAVVLPTRKTKLLLAYLALTPGKSHSRETLASLLWSDRGDVQARASLRKGLSALRLELAAASPPPLLSERQMIRFDTTAVEVDALTFERLVEKGTYDDLEQACALYRGDLLEGVSARDPPFEEWLFYERERLHDLALRAFEQLLAYQQEAGASEGAIKTALRLLKLEPAHEKTHRTLMHLYADQGRRAAAIRQYQKCRAALQRELGVQPGPKTEELYQEILHRRAKGPREGTGPSLPAKPSIAVLPLQNLSGDPGQEYFVDGFTDTIITELSRFRELFVIARSSTFTYKGKAINVQQVARELGVHYVLEGSVQKIGERLRVTAQLVNAATGHHVWAERYDREVKDLFAVQAEVTQQIVATVGLEDTGPLTRAALECAKRKPTDNLEAYDYYLLGLEHEIRFTKEDLGVARKLFQKAIELDPEFARPYGNLVFNYYWDWLWEWSDCPAESAKRALECAHKAVALDPADAYGRWALGAMYLYLKRRYDEAVSEYERALTLNPNFADLLADWGVALAHLGRADEGIEVIKKAMRLSPHYPDWYLECLGTGYYHARRYEDAIAALNRMSRNNPNSSVYLAASYAQSGREAEARAVATGILEAKPDFCLKRWAEKEAFKNQADLNHFVDGLRKAGLPE